MNPCIIGWAHTPFGRLDQHDLESLIATAASDALTDAGVEGREIDVVCIGNFGGFAPQAFPGSLAMHADAGLRFAPATRYENACASGSAALYAALDRIHSGRARFALVIGAEKMGGMPADEVARKLASASYVREEAAAGLTFPGIFAQLTQAYFSAYGDRSDALALVAAKNHANGVRNPLAHVRKDLGFEFCRHESARNRIVAPPLKVTDCSTIADGAAAVVIAAGDAALRFPKAVRFRAAQQVNDYLPLSRRDAVRYEGPREAFFRAYAEAGIGVDDLNFAEVHDCFTIAELLAYEAMGLAPEGEGWAVIEEGISEFDGRMPVNPSGGLKAKGHPVGATGVSMHVMAAMQLCRAAGDMQLGDPQLGAVFNLGGAGVASYVSVLEAIRA